MKNILVITGGAGFIGSNLIEFILQKTKYKIVSIDNYSSGFIKNHIKNSRIKYINADTQNIQTVLGKYRKQIKTIFHFGEFSRIYQSFKFTNNCFNSNIAGTLSVFLFCIKNKIKVIYSATSASLGNNGNDKNLSPYAFTKSINLNLLVNLNKWFGLSYEVLYFYNVYGKRQIDKGKMATVIGIFENCYKKGIPLPVVFPGTQKRTFTSIDDTIKGCYLAWKKNQNRHYSLSSLKSYSIIEVAKMFSNKIKIIPQRPGERNFSSTVKKNEGCKIYPIKCNDDLYKYINLFKKLQLKKN